VVAPLRHVEQWDALDALEQAELGPLLGRVCAALRAETPAAKVYVSVFAEVVAHLHVHVIARPPELPAEERGARVFLAEARTPEAERAELFRRVRLRLERGAASPGLDSWTPVLLSGLLWPGLGQIRNGDRLKGLVLGVLALVSGAVFAVRVASAAAAALLAAPETASLLDLVALARQVLARHGPELRITVLVSALVWAVSVWDAWKGARRSARG
jgi:hypothetical protein